LTDVFDAIRAACREVAQGARHVRLREERLDAFAAALPDAAATPGLDPAHHWLGHGEGTAVFLLLLDQVNFGSGWSAHLRKGPGLSTYFTTASALTRWFAGGGVPSAALIAELQEPEVARIFGQDGLPPGHPARELTALWTASLRDLAALVRVHHAGDWLGPVRAARGSAAALVDTLGRLPLAHDVQRWRGREVPFFKRAQITVSDLALAGAGADGEVAWWGRWDDLSRLTIFADNLVPHVLRVEGLLEYAPALAARIDAGQPVPRDSEEEVEIRACGLHAVELLVARRLACGRPATAQQLDQVLWNRGQSARIKAVPRHRTLTTFY
jgi:hypothetical protein